jgi:NTE family protein
MTRVGLVLGAGGLVGQAYHAGVLAALELDLGWDPRAADLVIGTSAGAVTGAMLRTGAPTLDLASWCIGQDWSPDHSVLNDLDEIRHNLPMLGLRTLLRPWRLPRLMTWLPRLERPFAFRPAAIVASMLPTGTTSFVDLMGDHLEAWSGDTWPEGLWICATRRSDGRREVFRGQPSETTSLSAAVAASSSIPGYFSPVTIAGTDYLDGGIYSPTNAELLVDEDLDLVIIVSPMSGGSGRLDSTLRSFARRRLRTEVTALERSGATVVTFEPGPVASAAMGMNPMAQDRSLGALRASFFETGAKVAESPLRELLRQSAPAKGAA